MGKYTPLARLGNGGMADVFLAVARGPMGFNKLTVVKRLRNSEENTHIQMFLDEARLAARLNHPNIVHTYEVGEVGGKFFLAMEYLEGQSLHQVLARLSDRGQGLSEPIVAIIASAALKALHHAHELCDFDGSPIGVVHRDVSPHNLFLTYGGEIKLLDFGIAKAAINSTHTEAGVLKGKLRYMAPEQVAGKPIDRRLDLFALGVVLWEMLARRPLFRGDAITILTRIASDTCPSVRSVRPKVPAELDAIVLRALRHEPSDRYPTADAMRADVEQFLRGYDVAALEKELTHTINDLFAETRDGVRARIKSFLANMNDLDDTPSVPGLTHASDLPPLLGDGGPVSAAPPSSSAVVVSPAGPAATASAVVVTGRSRGTWALVGMGAALIAALVVAGVSLGRRAPTGPAIPLASAGAAPGTAHVRITTTPPGALVERNGRPIDRTPAELAVEPGMQTIVLSREGYDTMMFSVDVKAGDTIERTIELHEKPQPSPAAATQGPRSVLVMPRSNAPSRAASAGTAAATATAPAGSIRSHPNIKILDDTDSP
jgi:serine/threonine-protein kinase